MADVLGRRNELRAAIVELRDRGLYPASKWAAEQLVGLPNFENSSAEEKLPLDRGVERLSQDIQSSFKQEAFKDESNSHEECNVEEDEDEFFLGKAYFDSREYFRAAHALRTCKGKKSFFLRQYSLYLAGERRKEEENLENSGPLGRSDAVNRELSVLEETLSEASAQGKLDAFGNFLFGIVLRHRSKPEKAADMLCASVHAFPCNWTAWIQLQELCPDSDAFHALLPRLPTHWVRTFWEASVLLDLHRNAEGLAKFRKLRGSFPRSETVSAQTALAHYNLRQFDEAEEMFEQMAKRDPYRVDHMDVYSNILYVKEMFAALSFLAHKAVQTDKYRPETCCIVGNYFSLKAQHERAILYFQRALKLNRAYLSAWTLMGHEYVEMKNTQAAVHSYRRAVDINPRDYRAWYGLGQTYEILGMPQYALYYYRRACHLRPTDPRMWCAMGQCMQTLSLPQNVLSASASAPQGLLSASSSSAALSASPSLASLQAALRCFRRAVQYGDTEGMALSRLAGICAQMGRNKEAAFYYRKDIHRIEAEGQEGQPQHLEALLFLAQYMRAAGNFQEAQSYCYRLLDFGGPATEDARAMQREIESVQMHGSPSSAEDMDINGSP